MPLPLLAACLIATWVGFAVVDDLAYAGNLPFHLLYGAAAILFLLGAARLRAAQDERALRVVIGVALVCRLLALALTPSLSDDWFRYVWEGRVQLAGVNPYAVPPEAASLAALRDPFWLGVNHGHVPAIYGPLLQLCFAPLSALSGLLPFKLFFLAADLGLAALILGRLRRRGLPLGLLVLYLWHPLPILEVAGQAHLEIVPVALMVLALELEERGRARAAALALGAAIAAKYLPLLLVPAFLRAAPPGHRLERAGWIALPVVVCTLPYAAAGAGLIEGLVSYGQSWRFNDGGFWLIDQALTQSGLSAAFCRTVLPAFVHVDPGYDPATHTTWMRIPAKLVVGLIVLAVTWHLSRPRAHPSGEDRVDLDRAALGAGLLFLACSPTVHPWYALWVVPFLATAPRATPWLLLTLTLPFAYRVKLLGWQEEPWVRALVYLPVVAVAIACLRAPAPAEPPAPAKLEP